MESASSSSEFVVVKRVEFERMKAELKSLRAAVRTRMWRDAIVAAWAETQEHHRSTLTRRCV